MGILLLLLCFTAIFINMGIFANAGKRQVLLQSVLVFCLLVVAVTELLSALQLITFAGICYSWLTVLAINAVILFKKRVQAAAFFSWLRTDTGNTFGRLSRFEKFLLWSAFIILILVFIQGIAYPPNNWDSMYYHMARIPNWISHRSLRPYPTHMITQIYQPPFAEYVILNFNMLTGADYFSNTVQFLFFLFAIVGITLIVKDLRLGRHYQIAAIFLAVVTPEIILQASTTQNDLVNGFFIVTAYYFALQASSKSTFNSFFYLALAGGIALLTKGTAYMYLCPLLLILGIRLVVRVVKEKNYRPLAYVPVVLAIFLAINAGYYNRNYNLNGTLLGVDHEESREYSNQHMSPLLLLSSVVKNAGLHMGIMGTDKLALASNAVVYKFHHLIGVDPNLPGNNLQYTVYSSPTGAVNHEDGAANFMNFWLIFISSIIICVQMVREKKATRAGLLLLVIFCQILVFCYILRWQPWNTRLHVPLFLLSVPLVCYALSVSTVFKRINYKAIFCLLLFYISVIVLHNNIRPYISLSSKKPYFTTKMPIFEPRYEKYFANIPDHYPEYTGIVNIIHQKHFTNIGLITGHFDYEYPLFTDCYTHPYNPVSLVVDNFTNKATIQIKDVDCIVSTIVNIPYIDYNGKRYYNQDSGNKFIHLYE